MNVFDIEVWETYQNGKEAVRNDRTKKKGLSYYCLTHYYYWSCEICKNNHFKISSIKRSIKGGRNGYLVDTAVPPGSQAVSRENKHQPTVSGEKPVYSSQISK
jgi:hypothetical protein